MFRNRNKVDNHIYEGCGSTWREGSTKDEVENDKEDSVVEKAELIIKKDMEHNEITREKLKLKIGSPLYEREF